VTRNDVAITDCRRSVLWRGRSVRSRCRRRGLLFGQRNRALRRIDGIVENCRGDDREHHRPHENVEVQAARRRLPGFRGCERGRICVSHGEYLLLGTTQLPQRRSIPCCTNTRPGLRRAKLLRRETGRPQSAIFVGRRLRLVWLLPLRRRLQALLRDIRRHYKIAAGVAREGELVVG